jgi:hypothetical protein
VGRSFPFPATATAGQQRIFDSWHLTTDHRPEAAIAPDKESVQKKLQDLTKMLQDSPQGPMGSSTLSKSSDPMPAIDVTKAFQFWFKHFQPN